MQRLKESRNLIFLISMVVKVRKSRRRSNNNILEKQLCSLRTNHFCTITKGSLKYFGGSCGVRILSDSREQAEHGEGSQAPLTLSPNREIAHRE